MTDSTHQRRLDAVVAGHRSDTTAARAAVNDASASVRIAALGALARAGELDAATVRSAMGDEDPTVRARGVELAIGFADIELRSALTDDDARVVEAGAFALGEREDATAVEVLATVASEHPDELCRESAVAALGAVAHRLADPDAVIVALLSALDQKPTIRRRAIIGLHQFDDERAEGAVAEALTDHDRQVRGLAGDLLGVAVD